MQETRQKSDDDDGIVPTGGVVGFTETQPAGSAAGGSIDTAVADAAGAQSQTDSRLITFAEDSYVPQLLEDHCNSLAKGTENTQRLVHTLGPYMLSFEFDCSHSGSTQANVAYHIKLNPSVSHNMMMTALQTVFGEYAKDLVESDAGTFAGFNDPSQTFDVTDANLHMVVPEFGIFEAVIAAVKNNPLFNTSPYLALMMAPPETRAFLDACMREKNIPGNARKARTMSLDDLNELTRPIMSGDHIDTQTILKVARQYGTKDIKHYLAAVRQIQFEFADKIGKL